MQPGTVSDKCLLQYCFQWIQKITFAHLPVSKQRVPYFGEFCTHPFPSLSLVSRTLSFHRWGYGTKEKCVRVLLCRSAVQPAKNLGTLGTGGPRYSAQISIATLALMLPTYAPKTAGKDD